MVTLHVKKLHIKNYIFSYSFDCYAHTFAQILFELQDQEGDGAVKVENVDADS